MSEDENMIASSGLPIVWVLGGPGSGKGTQCEKIVEEYGFTHLSSGQLLRDEVSSGSDRGNELAPIIANGQLVSLATVLQLVKEAILKSLPTSKGFLIDGYPRDVAQAEEFERTISPCKQIIYFELSDETMASRLLQRGRADDNAATIAKRLTNFHKKSKPVITAYASKCSKINAERTVAEVFLDVKTVLENIKT